MANLSTLTLPQFSDLVTRSFKKNIEPLPNTMRTSGIVVEDPIAQGTGDTRRHAERLHRDQYASKRGEGNRSRKARVQYGYEKDLRVYTITLEISITKRMRLTGKNRDILDSATDLVATCPNRMDLDLAHRLTFAWSTTYTDKDGETVSLTTGDGFAVISGAHTLTGSGTTYSTQITGNPAFSKGALAAGERSFAEETYSNLGEKMAMKPNLIITGDDPHTIYEVRELLNAQADVDTNNSGTFNVYRGSGYRHTIVPRIATTATGAVDTSKRTYRFLCCTQMSDFYLSILEEPYLKTPMDGNNGEDFSSENWNFLAGATYGIAVVTARWIRGSKGDGSA